MWLLLLACVTRSPERPPPPELSSAEIEGAAVTLRCAGVPDCPERAQRAARALSSDGWAVAKAAAGGEAWLARGDDALAVGTWPVTLPHPALPEGQALATFNLTDAALSVRHPGPGRLLAVVHPDPERATALAEGGALASEVVQAGAWALRRDEGGAVHELGDPAGLADGLRLSP